MNTKDVAMEQYIDQVRENFTIGLTKRAQIFNPKIIPYTWPCFINYCCDLLNFVKQK